MITLYELHWSHYCEKIRLLLDVAGLPWKRVGIDAFSKAELLKYPVPGHLPNRTVPAIYDDATDVFVMDSTPIVRYLASRYPQVQELCGATPDIRKEVDARLVEFDGVLGIGARRFGYTQVILECPTLLPRLFVPNRANGLYCKPLLRHLSGAVLGMLLSKRFDFHRSESAGLWETLEGWLLNLGRQIDRCEFIVGNQLTVADLAFAAQYRPLTIVPYFREHPGLQSLYARHCQVLQQHGREGLSSYQQAINEVRTRRAPVRRRIRQHHANFHLATRADVSANDHQELWNKAMWLMPWHYWVTLRRGKKRMSKASARYR